MLQLLSSWGQSTDSECSPGSIVWFTKRNNGMYEPEMRLYLATFPALVGPAGLFLYGYSTAAVGFSFFVAQSDESVLTSSQGMPWIVPCVGAAMFGFTITALGDTSLTYLSDSYREVRHIPTSILCNTCLTGACSADSGRFSCRSGFRPKRFCNHCSVRSCSRKHNRLFTFHPST